MYFWEHSVEAFVWVNSVVWCVDDDNSDYATLNSWDAELLLITGDREREQGGKWLTELEGVYNKSLIIWTAYVED